MNKNFHEWYLEVCPKPEEGQEEKRIKCIEEFAKNADIENIRFLLRLYYKMPVDPESLDRFAVLFSQKDPSFSKKSKEELVLLAGVTLLEIVENSSMYDIVELLMLSSSFGFEQVSFPAVLDSVKCVFDEDRRNLRERLDGQNTLAISVEGLAELKEYIGENNWDEDAPIRLLQVLDSFQDNLHTIAKRIMEQEGKHSIYKEDSQLLWWMLSEWSNILSCQLKTLGKGEGSLVIGYEAAQFVTNYPGPYAMEGIFTKMVSICKGNQQKKIPFQDCVMQIPSVLREKIIESAKNSPVMEFLPLCNGIISSLNAESADEWYPKFRREFLKTESESFSPFQYAWQMYIEALTLCCHKNYCK